MDSWVVPLIVGVATSLATVTVGLLTYRQSRRDIRENLKRDIELHASMPTDWHSREVLQWYIERRVKLLPIDESSTRSFKVLLTLGALGPVVGLAGSYRLINDGFWPFFWQFLLGMLLVSIGAFTIFYVRGTTRSTHERSIVSSFNAWRANQTGNRRPPNSSQ